MTKRAWLDASPTLFVQSEGQSCERFFANFFRNTRHFVLRGTGGCGNMTPEYYHGITKLQEALGGDPNVPGSPKFSGFCLFGGTRMILKDDPSSVVPGITENPCSDAASKAKTGANNMTENPRYAKNISKNRLKIISQYFCG